MMGDRMPNVASWVYAKDVLLGYIQALACKVHKGGKYVDSQRTEHNLPCVGFQGLARITLWC